MQNGKADYQHGDMEAALKSAAKTIAAEYRVPVSGSRHDGAVELHGSIQRRRGDRVDWPRRTQAFARDAIAKVLGIKADKVK